MMRSLNLLSAKPVLYVANVDESELTKADTISADLAKRINHNPEDVIIVSAKLKLSLLSSRQLMPQPTSKTSASPNPASTASFVRPSPPWGS